MSSKRFIPIDLPRDLVWLGENFPEEIKTEIERIVSDAIATDRWRTPEDMGLDPHNIPFCAYYTFKSVSPIKEPVEGHGIKERLARFRKVRFDLAPPGFKVEKRYRLSAVGDLMFAKYAEESKDRLYQYVEDLIFGADYAYANLESTISPGVPGDFILGKQGDTPYINITVSQYEALVKHRQKQFSIVQIANNHILDCGEEGIALTIGQLKADRIDYIGVYETEAQSRSVKTTLLDGIKIGWIGHTYGVNFKPVPKDKPWVCDVTPFHIEKSPDISRIERQITDARKAGCDLVFVTLHWGYEHELYPHPDQFKWAARFAELGADAIICHHPHVIQPVEIIQLKNDPGRSVPVLYSLGNLTPGYGSAATVLSLIANLTISRGQLKGEQRTLITGLQVTPVAFMGEKDNDRDFAAIVPLALLVNSDLDGETREYVDQIVEIADLLLGQEWRKPT